MSEEVGGGRGRCGVVSAREGGVCAWPKAAAGPALRRRLGRVPRRCWPSCRAIGCGLQAPEQLLCSPREKMSDLGPKRPVRRYSGKGGQGRRAARGGGRQTASGAGRQRGAPRRVGVGVAAWGSGRPRKGRGRFVRQLLPHHRVRRTWVHEGGRPHEPRVEDGGLPARRERRREAAEADVAYLGRQVAGQQDVGLWGGLEAVGLKARARRQVGVRGLEGGEKGKGRRALRARGL